MDDLLTIHAFAEQVGLKPQGIYKQATNESSRLYPYVVLQKGKRYIKKEALFEVYQINQPSQPTEPTEPTPNENQTNRANQPNQPNQTTETTQPQDESIVDFLKEMLRERDKQIERLTTLLDQEQHLHAQTKLLLKEYQEREEVEPQEEVRQAEPVIDQEPKKKSNWFRRWFFGEE